MVWAFGPAQPYSSFKPTLPFSVPSLPILIGYPWQIFPQTGLKKFLEYVQHGAAEKVARLLDKGLDPNYHDSDTGGKCYLGVTKREERMSLDASYTTSFSTVVMQGFLCRNTFDLGCPVRWNHWCDPTTVPWWCPHRFPGKRWSHSSSQSCLFSPLFGPHGKVKC